MDKKQIEYRTRYAKRHLKRVPLDVRKEYFENILKPAADMCDVGVNTFVKMAIMEKIARENLNLPTGDYRI